MSRIDAARFVTSVQPLLERKDMKGLLALLRSNWTAEQITDLLAGPDCDARKVAALALSLVGGHCCIEPLARQLKDHDPVVNEMAEHALWSIWFRLGSEPANHHVCRGSQALSRRDFEEAISLFTKAIEIDPTFAEPYNQRAIAHYLQEHYKLSIEDCRRTIERMPCHFGAWAGLGHCHAHLEHVPDAIVAYERALDLNPHLSCVSETLEQLRQRLHDGPA